MTQSAAKLKRIKYNTISWKTHRNLVVLEVEAGWPRFEGGCDLGEHRVPELMTLRSSVGSVDSRSSYLYGSVLRQV